MDALNRPTARLLRRLGVILPILCTACGSPWPSLLTQPQQKPTVPRFGEAQVEPVAADAALIVSIERYAHLPVVRGAGENAAAWRYYFRDVLEMPSTRVHLLEDGFATAGRISKKLDDVVESVGPGGRLWLVFIGHGTVAARDGAGLLVAADAERSTVSIEENSVRLQAVLDRLADVEHVAFIDACFSGVDRRGKALDPDLQQIRLVRAPQVRRGVVLTATERDQTAGQLRHGRRPAFSYLALSALRGWADTVPGAGDQDGRLTAGELVAAVRVGLDKVNHHRPTPSIYPPSAADFVLVERAADPVPEFDDILESQPSTRHDALWLAPVVAVSAGIGVWLHNANQETFIEGSKLASPPPKTRERLDLEANGAVASYAVAGVALAGLLVWWLTVPEDDGGMAIRGDSDSPVFGFTW